MSRWPSRLLKSAAGLLLIVVAVLVIAVFLSGGAPLPGVQAAVSPENRHAKNVIVLIGDGMGSAELTAAHWELSGGT